MNNNKTFKKIIIRLIIFMLLLILVCVGILVVREKFTVVQVDVSGNEHYTVQEIKDFVMDGTYGNNTIYLYLKYRNKSVDDIPFIEKMDVSIESPTHIKINVYEKALAGYIEYLGHYVYFDREGIAVESSTTVIDGIPFVTGLDFDHIVLHQKLPAKNDKIFAKILNITQLLTKYSIATDKIYFDNDENITLYFGTARVFLGTDDYIDEKTNELRLILGELNGYSGVLHMENYKGEGGNFTFEKDEERPEEIFELDIDGQSTSFDTEGGGEENSSEAGDSQLGNG